MAINMKNIILKKKLDGILYELMAKTTVAQVQYDDTTTLAAKLTAMLTDINDAKTKLAELIGEDSAGSISSQIEAAVTEAIAAVENEEDPESLAGKIKAINETVTTLETDLTNLTTRVGANEDAIALLNADETTEGSVKKQVADAVAKIVSEAPEAYDTLKEISDWISTHADSASTMNSNILANTQGIAALQTLIGTLPEGITASDVVGYIQEAAAAAQAAAEANLENRATELETTIATKARFIVATEAPDDLTENDIFAQIIEDEVTTE